LRELEHVCAPGAVCPDSPLGRVKPAIGVDELLEAAAETGMRRPDHDLGLVASPGSQTADPSEARCIAHVMQHRLGGGLRSSAQPLETSRKL
jgi:hypothetical protein